MSDPFLNPYLEPMLIGIEQPAFDDPQFIFELKLDGTRCLAYLDDQTRLYNKRKLSITHKFPELCKLHTMVKRRCVLDGELFVYHDGNVDFFASQRRSLMNNHFRIQLASKQYPATFTAFDILYDQDQYVVDEPLMKRKKRLERIIKEENDRFSITRYIEEQGTSLFALTKEKHLEGIVAKKKNSRYEIGKRTKQWIKCKHWEEDDFVVCGYIEKEKGILSFVLGQYDKDKLVYQGHVTMGAGRHLFHDHTFVKTKCPFDIVPSGNEHAVWLSPMPVCVVSYMERTPQGGLRQPVCRGFRNDKDPKDCQLTLF